MKVLPSRLNLPFSVCNTPCTLLRITPNIEEERQFHYENRHFSKTPRPFTTPHVHSSPEFRYVLKGQCTVTTEQGKYDLHAGQLLLIPPGLTHQSTYTAPDTHSMNLNIHIDAKRSPSTPSSFFAVFYPNQPQLVSVPPDSKLLVALLELQRRGSHIFGPPSGKSPDPIDLDPVAEEHLRIYASLFLLELYCLLKEADAEPNLRTTPDASQRFTIDEFFSSHFYHTDGSTRLAKQLHISPRQLNRIITELYGMNFRQKLVECRLNLAKSLLADPNNTVAHIARSLGYSNPAAFYSFFKNATGQTPAQFRNSLLAQNEVSPDV